MGSIADKAKYRWDHGRNINYALGNSLEENEKVLENPIFSYVKPMWYAGETWSVDLMKAAIFLQHVTLMTQSWESF